jgi:hypothetical protein
MALTETHPSQALSCGHDAVALCERVVAGEETAADHSCPVCAEVVAGLEPLRAATGELAAQSAEPPDRLVDRAMRLVRAERRPGRLLSLPVDQGSAVIAETAVADLVRQSGVGGIIVRRCRIRPAQASPGSDGAGAGGRTGGGGRDADDRRRADSASVVDVEVDVVADYGADAAAAADELRRSAIAGIRAAAGLVVAHVDVRVVNVDDVGRAADGEATGPSEEAAHARR